ncbi:hypothetical protein EYR40_008268 [Pleurotus pulmonarius]|nr:hypothetical protein EYR36_009089 [Pleurotus pulmonarius]KAF4597801.1 hypothetical protein EYR40_008268 [Pleurotus pulmonarius]
MIFDRKEKPEAEEPTEAPPYNQVNPISEPGPAFRTTFACMSMNSTYAASPSARLTPLVHSHHRHSDLLRLIQFPPEPARIVRNAITQSWPRGIKEERDYHGAHEFKLKGNPWSGQGTEAVPSRIFMCQVLADLYNAGWVLFASTDISKNGMDKDSCLFRYQQPAPPPCSWMSISFNRGDRLRLIGAPQEIIAPFGRVMGPLLQKEGFIEHGAYEFKCKGWPWYAMGGDTVATRVLLLRILELLERFGFSLYASIDQSIGAGGDATTSETDTWYCCRQLSWTPGAPVFH